MFVCIADAAAGSLDNKNNNNDSKETENKVEALVSTIEKNVFEIQLPEKSRKELSNANITY